MDTPNHKLIVSMHVPKTGGTSLMKEIQAGAMGRYFLDYERPGAGQPFIWKKLILKKQYLMARLHKHRLLNNYDVIHGHFPIRKYIFLYPKVDFITFLREPVSRILSAYYYFKDVASKNPRSVHNNPNILLVSQNKLSLLEFAARYVMRSIYSILISGLTLQEFTMIGITERYQDSIALLNKMYGMQIKVRHERNNDYKRYEDEYRPLLPELYALNKKNTLIYEEALRVFDEKYKNTFIKSDCI